MPSSLNTTATLAEVFSVIEETVPRKVIARVADVDERTVGHWRNGRSYPDFAVFERMLACDVEALVTPLSDYIMRRNRFRKLVPLDHVEPGDVATHAPGTVKEATEFFMAAATDMPLEVLEKEGRDVVQKVQAATAAKRAQREPRRLPLPR